jgi:uncharacterized protein RhaS with RHS repeats
MFGRFLTTDPIVSRPLSGDSWNPHSYVINNPLNYVDPSGFDPDPYYIDSTGAAILKSVWGFANSIANINAPKGPVSDGSVRAGIW